MPYYGDKAYNSQAIPSQAKPQTRGWLKQFAQIPLPWGYTEQAVPNLFFQGHSPAFMLRNAPASEKVEQWVKDQTYTLDPSNNALDQQRIRYSPLAARTRIIAYGSIQQLQIIFMSLFKI